MYIHIYIYIYIYIYMHIIYVYTIIYRSKDTYIAVCGHT
jgi:hypothetical protein